MTAVTASERSRRSVHFVPGSSEKMLAKAVGLAADTLVLDLEDSVPIEHKAEARERVAAWLAARPDTHAELAVRINPLDSDWAASDLAAVLPHAPDALMIPKVESADALRQLDADLTRLERNAGLSIGATVLILIATETPRSVFRLESLAAAPRVSALTWGAEDLSAALQARRTRDDAGRYLPVFEQARALMLLAARAAGVQAIDGVYTEIGDLTGLDREAREAADMGFDGKLSLHPSQLTVCNACFAPTQHEIDLANELLAAWNENSRAGRGAFRFRGEMVDIPHIARAEALLARARRAGLVAGS